MLQKIDGKLVVTGNLPATGNELGKALSSANFQSLGPKPAPAQPPVNSSPPPSVNTAAPAKS